MARRSVLAYSLGHTFSGLFHFASIYLDLGADLVALELEACVISHFA